MSPQEIDEKPGQAQSDPAPEAGARQPNLKRRPLGEWMSNALSPKFASRGEWEAGLAMARAAVGRRKADLSEFNDYRLGCWSNAVAASGAEGAESRRRFSESFGSAEWMAARVLAWPSSEHSERDSHIPRTRVQSLSWPYSFTAQADMLLAGVVSKARWGDEAAEEDWRGELHGEAPTRSEAGAAVLNWAQALVSERIRQMWKPKHTSSAAGLARAFSLCAELGVLEKIKWRDALRNARRRNLDAFEKAGMSFDWAAIWPLPGQDELSAVSAQLTRVRESVVGKPMVASEWARWIGRGEGCGARLKWLQAHDMLSQEGWGKLIGLRSLSGEARALLESQWIQRELKNAAAAAPGREKIAEARSLPPKRI